MDIFYEGTKQIVTDLDPLFLDYIEAQRSNILLCEPMQWNIDNLEFPRIQQTITDLKDHFTDLADHDPDFIEKAILQNQFINLLGIIYFETLEYSDQVLYLNVFYGLPEVFNGSQTNLSLLSLDRLCYEIHFWARFGLPGLFRNVL